MDVSRSEAASWRLKPRRDWCPVVTPFEFQESTGNKNESNKQGQQKNIQKCKGKCHWQLLYINFLHVLSSFCQAGFALNSSWWSSIKNVIILLSSTPFYIRGDCVEMSNPMEPELTQKNVVFQHNSDDSGLFSTWRFLLRSMLFYPILVGKSSYVFFISSWCKCMVNMRDFPLSHYMKFRLVSYQWHFLV